MSNVVVVTKDAAVFIQPLSDSPPPCDTVALSSFDKRVPPIPVTSLLVFDSRIHNPVETTRKALSRALAYYRPLAGRLDGDGGRIACTDEGATFVGASASCSLEQARAALQQMDLAVRYPGLLCRDANPLLMVQVTEFTCGGFVIGVTKNHVVADGVGMAQFLLAVGELARGITPPSVVPTRRWDESALSSVGPSSTTIVAASNRSTMEHELKHLARLDVVVPWSLISRIKSPRGFGGGGEPACTVLDAVMAVLWRCRTRATIVSPESPVPLRFVCNMRAHAGAPAGYYGNCIRVQVVPATAGAVAHSSIADLVRLIGRAKEKVPDLLLSSSSSGGVAAAAGQEVPLCWYDTFRVTDWRHLGLDAIDLGGGAPERVLWHYSSKETKDDPGCVVYPPRRGRRDDGGVDVSSMFLKPEHVDGFLMELARLAASAE